MRTRLIVTLLFFVGCNEGRPKGTAPAGAPPPIGVPVGPVPGPEDKKQPESSPYAKDPAGIQQGRLLFGQYNCSGCHGDHAGGGMGPSLRDEVWIYGSTDAAIFGSITEGRAHGMPAWGTKIPSDQAWKLVSYIKSMRSSMEPSPPDQTLPRQPIP